MIYNAVLGQGSIASGMDIIAHPDIDVVNPQGNFGFVEGRKVMLPGREGQVEDGVRDPLRAIFYKIADADIVAM